MSLYGMMRTGVSGMAGQANRLSAVADNIANSDTTGYKRSKTEFATLVIPAVTSSYNSGGITTEVRYQVAEQGVLQYTSSSSDLAINGKGFFVVQDASGTAYLTRAGSFVPDGQGRFVNAAGYFLTGYPDGTGAVSNSMTGLEVIQVDAGALTTTPSSTGEFAANLPAGAAAVVAADLPSANAASAAYSAKTSLVAYDNLGAEVTLDVYFAKTGANTWEATVYNHADAAAGGGFPYGAAALVTQPVSFDGATGHITGGGTMSIPVPGGLTVALNMSQTTQLATAYSVTQASVDGNGPSAVEKIEFSTDGTMYATYGDGTFRALFRIPLADVPSPDMLHVLPGNVYGQSSESGDIRLGFPSEGTFGTMVSGAVEGSNVDIGNELTDMIASQRSYTANSKVFQTGADLLDILVNLKR